MVLLCELLHQPAADTASLLIMQASKGAAASTRKRMLPTHSTYSFCAVSLSLPAHCTTTPLTVACNQAIPYKGKPPSSPTLLLLPCVPFGAACVHSRLQGLAMLMQHLGPSTGVACQCSSPFGSQMPGLPAQGSQSTVSTEFITTEVAQKWEAGSQHTTVHVPHSSLLEEAVQRQLVVIACLVRQRLGILCGLVEELLMHRAMQG